MKMAGRLLVRSLLRGMTGLSWPSHSAFTVFLGVAACTA